MCAERYGRVLVVVDMQNDFITGPLGCEDTRESVGGVVEAISDESYEAIFVTMDTHTKDYLLTQEGRCLPIAHCVEGTPGWNLVPEVEKALGKRDNVIVIKKDTFGSPELVERIRETCKEDAEVDLVGVCTDICVVSNAMMLKSYCPEMPLSVIAHACGGTSRQRHNTALMTMESCQIRIV